MRLKYLLGLGLLTLIGLVNFSSAFDYPGFTKIGTIHINSDTYSTFFNGSTVSPTSLQSSNLGFYCSVLENFSYIYDNLQDTSTNTNNLISIGIGITANTVSENNSYLRTSLKTFSKEYFSGKDIVICGSNFLSGFSVKSLFVGVNNSNSNFLINGTPNMSFDWSLYYASFDYKCPTCPTCEICDYSSYESQIESLSGNLASCSASYNSCITDYGNCSNSLNYCYYDLGDCRAGNCSGSYDSNIYINNIQYPSNTNLFVNIPSEFDYTYNMTGNDSSIDVEYKVDTGYMVGVITNQMTLPNATDLNNLISYLLPLFVPGLVIVLFLYFVFRLLKKIF